MLLKDRPADVHVETVRKVVDQITNPLLHYFRLIAESRRRQMRSI